MNNFTMSKNFLDLLATSFIRHYIPIRVLWSNLLIIHQWIYVWYVLIESQHPRVVVCVCWSVCVRPTSVCVCACVCLCGRVCLSECLCVCACMRVSVRPGMCACVCVCVSGSICVCLCLSVHACVYAGKHLCVSVCLFPDSDWLGSREGVCSREPALCHCL